MSGRIAEMHGNACLRRCYYRKYKCETRRGYTIIALFFKGNDVLIYKYLVHVWTSSFIYLEHSVDTFTIFHCIFISSLQHCHQKFTVTLNPG